MPHEYPHRYFYRGYMSDKKFILSRMSVIPDELKHEVSLKYMGYRPWDGGEGRKLANTWLHEEALKYRNVPRESTLKVDAKAPESAQVASNQKVDAIVPEKRKGFLDSLLDDVDEKHRKRK